MTSPAVSRWVPPPCDSPAAPRWPNRPFSASGARGGSLLTLLVHFGRQLDALGFASTFVAASVSTEPLAATASVNTSGVTLYDNRSSPFAVTRVIPTGDAWNELLALSLPPNWRSSLPESSINLCIDLVARGASQQEDFLLARRLVALAEALPRSDEQVRLALPLAVENRDGPSLYVSVQEHSRTFPDAADAQTELQQIGDEKARFELLVQSLSLVPSTPPRTLPEALAVMVWVDSGGPSELSSTSNLDSLFRVDAFPHTKQRPASSGASGLTPFANCQSRGAVASTYEWRFPLTFRLGVAAAKRFRVEVFSDPDGRLVASGLLELSRPENSSTQSLLAKRSGSVVQIPPIPVVVAQESRSPTRGGQLQGADGVLIGHLHTRARVWSASSWREFMRETQARRIVCSNRTGNGLTGANTQPEWFSAILRGLNRNPVASICDEGGVTSVLAAVMSGDSGDASAHPAPAVSVSSNQSVTQLLQSQVAHLLAESESQQQQIKRLQLDLEARLQAIKSCGLEMVALQRELQARDEQIARLKLQLGVPPTAESLIEAGGDRTAQRLRALAAKCSELEQERGGLLAEAEAARQSLASLRSLEAQYAELQQAHVAQAALVQRLQRDKQQAGPLRRAVRVQEKVIRQFERTVALQSSPLPVESPVDAAAERATPRDELPPREEALAMRVRALERQLEANARAAAAERSALRLRVAELEAAAARR